MLICIFRLDTDDRQNRTIFQRDIEYSHPQFMTTCSEMQTYVRIPTKNYGGVDAKCVPVILCRCHEILCRGNKVINYGIFPTIYHVVART